MSGSLQQRPVPLLTAELLRKLGLNAELQAGDWGTLWRLAFPLTRPALVTASR